MKILRHEKFKDIRFLWTSTHDKPVSNSQRNDKNNNKKQIQETSYFLSGRQKKQRSTEEPPRRILFLTLAKFRFNRDGEGVLNSLPPKNTLYR